MTKFSVEISTENAAFFPNWEDEVIRILRRLADDLEKNAIPDKLRDINGNTVGTVWYDTLIHREDK